MYHAVRKHREWRFESPPMDEEHRPDQALDEAELMTLMAAYQHGSLAAFEGLYAALAAPVRAHMLAAVGRDATAADLVQECFLEVHRARQSHRPGAPVRPWLFGIARHVLMRHYVRERRRAGKERRWAAPAASTQTAHSEAIAGVQLQQLEHALQALSPPSRTVWLMHHVEGRAFEDIARHLGIAAAAARLRASRASRALRRALGVGEDDDG
jgi:RNA polymerase sigma-70 factor, ECF subfamily